MIKCLGVGLFDLLHCCFFWLPGSECLCPSPGWEVSGLPSFSPSFPAPFFPSFFLSIFLILFLTPYPYFHFLFKSLWKNNSPTQWSRPPSRWAVAAAARAAAGECWIGTEAPAHRQAGRWPWVEQQWLWEPKQPFHAEIPPQSPPWWQQPALPFRSRRGLCRRRDQAWPPVGVGGRCCHTCTSPASTHPMAPRLSSRVVTLEPRPHGTEETVCHTEPW